MVSKLPLFILISVLFLTQEVFPQRFNAEVIKYSTLCEVGKGKLMVTDSITIQINNRVGDKYTDISLPYSKTDEISDIDGWIENMDGTKVRSLKKSDITIKSALSNITFYGDSYNKFFQLKHNVYPYKITYTYKTTYSDFISIAHWSPIIYSSVPTRSAKLNIVLPKGFPFNHYENNISGGYCIDSTENKVFLQWTTSYEKLLKSEIYSQLETFWPYIIVAPLHFKYGIEGSTKDWESYGNWQYRLIQDLDILPDDEKKTISSLINGITDKKEIVKILYHYLQDHTRYINVSIGIGGFKPYSASYVAQNKYGDCKALSNYMKAMLSFAGIESIYANVNASDQPRTLFKTFAGPQFNHIVLAVPLKNDTIWLDNTVNTGPFGYMGTFTQNRDALLITKDQSKLVRIPALKTEDILVKNKLTFDLNVSGKASVKLYISFKGKDFEKFNQIDSKLNDVEKDKNIREYMPFDNYEVINWDLKKLHRDSAQIELNATLNLNKFLKPLGNEYYFSLFPNRVPAFTSPANRTLPLVLPYPICNSDSLIYNPPIGYELKTILDPISIKTQFGSYEQASKVINGKIYVTIRFALFQGSYSLGQYPDFYSFIQSVKDTDKKKIIIKPIN